MGQEFKFKIDEMRENNPGKQQQIYAGESHVRNVCFVQSDGKMLFLNYGYLVSGEYLPDESKIVLHFTSHTIALKGTKLETLYQEFFSHIPRYILATNERYIEVEKSTYTISEIQVSKI